MEWLRSSQRPELVERISAHYAEILSTHETQRTYEAQIRILPLFGQGYLDHPGIVLILEQIPCWEAEVVNLDRM